MKRPCASLVLPVAMLFGTAVARAHPDGPPPGHTGGGSQPDCSQCHYAGPAPTSRSGLSVQGIPDSVEPGRTYSFRLLLMDPQGTVGGFQMMLHATGGKTGRLIPEDAQAVTSDGGINYLGHTAPMPAEPADASGMRHTEWVVRWQAPEEPGPVKLHVSAVAGNDDGSPLGDTVYRMSRPLVPAD